MAFEAAADQSHDSQISVAASEKDQGQQVIVPTSQYRYVKVSQDGKIVTVKRRLNSMHSSSQSIAVRPDGISGPTKSKNAEGHLAHVLSSVDTSEDHDLHESAAFQGQNHKERNKANKENRGSITSALSSIVPRPAPNVEIGTFQPGDEVVKHVDDPSDDDLDDDDHEYKEFGVTGPISSKPKGIEKNSMVSEASDSIEHSGEKHMKEEPISIRTTQEHAVKQDLPPAYATPISPNNRASYNTTVSDEKKDTYKLSVKELESGDSSIIDEERERPLKHRWANLSFYLMGTLSIVLPAIFITFAGLILGMNHKLVNSKWNQVDAANKIFISAWPIVFASVVAQVFKTIATFRIERGIRLGSLEQLVGSTSFGSTLKQPFMLRRVDFLALCLFVVWCFSPLGSQGLQRSYGTRPLSIQAESDVWYVDTSVPNQMFARDSASTGPLHATQVQIAVDFFLAAFLPVPRREILRVSDQDRYDNPTIPLIDLLEPHNGTGKTYYVPTDFRKDLTDKEIKYYGAFNHTSTWGVPMKLPDLMFENDVANASSSLLASASRSSPLERIDFIMKASYFNFTCGEFQTINWTNYDSNYNANKSFGTSNDYRFGLSMQDSLNIYANQTRSPLFRPNYLATVSLNTESIANISNPNPDPSWQFSFMECTFDRIFVNVGVSCVRGSGSQYLPLCQNLNVTLDHIENGIGQGASPFFRDFSKEWLFGTDLTAGADVATIFERFLINGTILDDPVNRGGDFASIDLGRNITARDHAFFIGHLFNTWVNLGYCPECMDANDYLPAQRSQWYTNSTATQVCHGEQEYFLKWGWFGLYLASALLLLIAGIASIVFESRTLAPDVLGYVNTAARNSRYLHLPKYTSAMPGSERAARLGQVRVMMQDVKADSDAGKIVIGMQHGNAQRLKASRKYR